HVSLQLAKGRSWPIVTQAEAQHIYDDLKKDLETIGYASYAVELIDKFTFEEEENQSIFNLLKNTLTRLDRGDPAHIVIRYYEIRLLDLLGFRPELKECVVSGEKIKPENQYFSAALGGIVSPGSGRDLSGAVPVSVRALKYLRHFQRSSYQDASRALISPEIQKELEVLMQYYLTYLLERGLNSPAFLRRVRRTSEGDD
nr:DNA repair protein RecO [Candidatus Saccharibacteria bacterium]